jgi:hypothetical protein
MDDEQFERFQILRRRIAGWQDGVELLLGVVLFWWAVEMIFMPADNTIDPIAMSLRNWLPGLPIWAHGYILGLTCLIHLAAAAGKDPDLRCSCCFFETCFFFYAWYAVILHHIYAPLAFCGPTFILFSAVNFWTLIRIVPAGVHDNGAEGMVVNPNLR